MAAPRAGPHRPIMHRDERRALARAMVLLVFVSLLRWGWAVRATGPEGGDETILSELLDASREATDEEARRAEPLAEGESVDPNRADEVELDRLPGVGPATARAILAARAAGAVFRSPEDLLAVRGIGPATLERIRGSLKLADPPPGRGLRTDPSVGPAPTDRVDVNSADLEALQTLPGIGPTLAQRIRDARDKQAFTSVEDLVRVRGIGPGTLERLRPHVTVGRVR